MDANNVVTLKNDETFPNEFPLARLTHSDRAIALGIKNQPDAAALQRLANLADQLEAIERILGHAISINSAYRGPELNARTPGASKTSAHMSGDAADITCHDFGSPREILRKLTTDPAMPRWDQVIVEIVRPGFPDGTWAHVSFAPTLRGRITIAKLVGGKVVYEDVRAL